ncbi:MAG: hypothetical protein UT90_C0024G0003 [Parcubacteria group bacterium GW2011_GWA1_40_21]|nr:MAG: hypothetical protein UT80_C0040G0003 [Parcubacteria group bacterium GW2011_GWC1_40_13]KKR52161.1 MAG: hypothetical protein UT90_C0024G0003 [Parcubacteria group bacterium GW2011_GWA1_40_21]
MLKFSNDYVIIPKKKISFPDGFKVRDSVDFILSINKIESPGQKTDYKVLHLTFGILEVLKRSTFLFQGSCYFCIPITTWTEQPLQMFVLSNQKEEKAILKEVVKNCFAEFKDDHIKLTYTKNLNAKGHIYFSFGDDYFGYDKLMMDYLYDFLSKK